MGKKSILRSLGELKRRYLPSMWRKERMKDNWGEVMAEETVRRWKKFYEEGGEVFKMDLLKLDGRKFEALYSGSEFGELERSLMENKPVWVEFDTLGVCLVRLNFTDRFRYVRTADGDYLNVDVYVKGELVGGRD